MFTITELIKLAMLGFAGFNLTALAICIVIEK